MSLDPRNAMGDSRFHQKFQPPDAHRLPHGGFTHRAETAGHGDSPMADSPTERTPWAIAVLTREPRTEEKGPVMSIELRLT